MELHENPYIAVSQIIQMILSDHISVIAFLIFCFIFRKSIEKLILKIWKGTVKTPDGSEISFEALRQDNSIKNDSNVSASDIIENGNDENKLLENVEDNLDEGEVEGEDENKPITIRSLFVAFVRKNSEEIDEIYEQLVSTNENENELINIKSIYLFGKYSYLKEHDNLENLLGLLDECKNDVQYFRVLTWITTLYEELKDFDKAIANNTEYIKCLKEELYITRLTIRIANTYKYKGDYISGIDIIKERLIQVKEDDSIALCYKCLGELYKESKEDEDAAICYEKYIEYHSDDDDEIFNAAYAQSNSNMDLLSLINYEIFCSLNSDNVGAINNLGVTFGELKLPGKKFSAFKEAADKGNTLSMANIANMYIKSGLYDEADKIIKEGRMSDNPHQNIGAAMTSLVKSIANEDEKIAEYRIRADKFRNEIRKYTHSKYQNIGTKQEFEGTWFTDDNDKLIVESDGYKLSAQWEHTVPGGLGLISIAQSKNPVIRVYKLDGVFINSSATLIMTSEIKNQIQSILGNSNESYNCRSYLSNDKKEWIIFDINIEKEFIFRLRRSN